MQKRKKLRRNYFLIIALSILAFIILINLIELFQTEGTAYSRLKGEMASLTLSGDWAMYYWESGTYCGGGFLPNGTKVITRCQNSSTGEWYAVPYCGNDKCDGNETSTTCPMDCQATRTPFELGEPKDIKSPFRLCRGKFPVQQLKQFK